MKRIIIYTFILIIMIALAYYHYNARNDDTSALQSATKERNALPLNSPQASHSDTANQDLDALARQLVTLYGDTIGQLNTQAELLQVKKNLMGHNKEYGAHWFAEIIRLAFPEHAEAILELIANLEHYENWLEENYVSLQELAPLAQNGAIWNKRHELFGADAEIIWKHERASMMQKQLEFQDRLHHLDQDSSLSLDEKLYQFRETIHEAYPDRSESLMVSASMVSQVFFNLSSVQKTLSELDADIRQQNINSIRQQMGFPEDRIKELEKLDQEREQRWHNGLKYMAQKQALEDALKKQTLTAQEFDVQLKALRTELFQHEAVTIEKEEQDGFFRYLRPRVYGRN